MGTSKQKLYNELGLESLQLHHWFRKLCYFYKFYKHKCPQYLFRLVPLRQSPYNTRNTKNIPLFKTKHNFFKNSFFPSALIEWNNLNHKIRSVRSYSAFKNNILKFIRLTTNVFNCKNRRGIKPITRLHVGLSHLCEHKFKHRFQDTLNPICSCSFDIESAFHYILHCPIYFPVSYTMMKDIPPEYYKKHQL